MAALSALDPIEIAALLVVLCGIVPLTVHYRRRSKWFVLAYGFIVVGAVATNLEALFLEEFFNIVEHGVGLMGAGVAFAAAAYVRRRNVLLAEGGEAEGRSDG